MKYLAFIALALAGCAVPTTGVVPRQEGMHTITRQGSGAWVQPATLTAAAVQEANTFCAKTGKQFQQIHVKEIPAGMMGRWPESELLFRCN